MNSPRRIPLRPTVLCLLLSLPLTVQAGPLPNVTFELSTAASTDVSVFCRPDGGGVSFTEAQTLGGGAIDATIFGVLKDDGLPIVSFPAEDMWLESSQGGLAICPGGTTADFATDAEGRTQWQLPLHIGGTSDQMQGHILTAFVNGAPFSEPSLAVFSLNSPDLNGDREVNLSDIAVFVQDLYGPYAYRSDFAWDGQINLSDVVLLATALGTGCP